MTSKRADVRRIMLALSDASSLPDLWRAATEHLADQEAELVTVFFNDDRWRRAASLPFTREILRISGGSTEFTRTRAEKLDREIIAAVQRRSQQFATEAKVRFVFEILSEQEIIKIHELLSSESDILIAPISFQGRPIYNEIARLKCQIRFV
ncbi:MAG: hypothetical protein OEM50_11435 [Gammaproteobacteria bacterium]|nr:hypothetical protein [Gammaproteobacteria bacterium]MDH3363276.1 hypothetical protein [Gammaproteobacteria bacterium]MDH3482322.1 hypothetical protein [Gammaproteobacteria bacterium]